ncbi:MAG: hypothetical protein NT062_02565, partial [Proteobacteria bacterium]|nr:hypothetical protein [Pseudomonadota bacterium]
MPPHSKRKARNQKVARYLKIAGDAGTIAMSLRDKPTPLDWFGVALRAVGLAITVHDERRRAGARDPWKYFTDVRENEWSEVPEEFRRLVMEHVGETTIDEAYWDGDEGSSFLAHGKIDGETIAWVGEGVAISDGPYVLSARATETYAALGKRLWRRLGGNQLLYGATGLVPDPFVSDHLLTTAQMRGLHDRVGRFL